MSLSLLTIKDITQKLRVSHMWVYRHEKAGKFPKRIRIGHLARWDATEFETWLAQRTKGMAG